MRYIIILIFTSLIVGTNPLYAQQTNTVDSLGRKQGLWVYYPDSIFHPGFVSFSAGYYRPNHIDSVRFLEFYDMDSLVNPFDNKLRLTKQFKVKQTFFEGKMHGQIEVWLDTFLIYTGTYINGKPEGMFLIYEYIKHNNIFYMLPCYTSSYKKGKAHGAFVTFSTGLEDVSWKPRVPFLSSNIIRVVFYKHGKISHKIYNIMIEDKPWVSKRRFKKWYF